jgi:hypothetical protein
MKGRTSETWGEIVSHEVSDALPFMRIGAFGIKFPTPSCTSELMRFAIAGGRVKTTPGMVPVTVFLH